jgi:hypothetical protein
VVYEDRDTILPRDLYRLAIDAEDVASGVADVKVLVDGAQVFDRPQPCPEGGCDMEVEDASVDARALTGVHRIDVAVTDAAGHVETVTWSVEFNGDPVDPDADQPLAAASTMFAAGCPDPTEALAIRPDAATPLQVRRGQWRTASGARGGETTAFYSGGAYRVTRCGTDGQLVVSQLVVALHLKGLAPGRFVISETRPIGIAGRYEVSVGVLPAPDDPQLIRWWRGGGAAQMAKHTIPPTA